MAEKRCVWKILMKKCLVMVTIISKRSLHTNYKGNCNLQNCFVIPNANGLTNLTEILIYIFVVVILQRKYKTKFWNVGPITFKLTLVYACVFCSILYRGLLSWGHCPFFTIVFLCAFSAPWLLSMSQFYIMSWFCCICGLNKINK